MPRVPKFIWTLESSGDLLEIPEQELSGEVEHGPLYFLKLPRWFQCVDKFGKKHSMLCAEINLSHHNISKIEIPPLQKIKQEVRKADQIFNGQ